MALENSALGAPPVSGSGIPHSIEVIAKIIKDYVPPDGPFDPSSDWDQKFTTWVPIRLVGGDWIAGSLNLSRRSRPGGFELAINQVSTRVPKGARPNREERLVANVICASDKTATPQRWTLTSEILDPAGGPVAFTRCDLAGESRPGQVQITRTKARTYRTGKVLSDRWTMMEAVQRLPFEKGTLRFDFLDDLEALKLGHKLSYAGATELELGGRRVRLHSFEQVGPGVLPITYWLDDKHRLLFVVGGIRAYILDAMEAS
jgi:hypothetical protein